MADEPEFDQQPACEKQPDPGPPATAESASGQAPSVQGPVVPAHVTVEPESGYTPAGVPTLEGVRDKIETRYGTALGATELAQETPEGRSASERYEAVRKAAAEKLEEIRASMRKPD